MLGVLLAVSLVALSLWTLWGCGDGAERPPVVLVTVDTLRADAIGLFGEPVLPTPAMDRIGREGAVAAQTVTSIPRTTQGVGSILTGLHPFQHGADGLGMVLPDEVTTLAEVLSERGYDTAAFVTNVNLKPGLGFEQGFDLYSNPESRWKGNSAVSVTEEALAWLRGREAGGEPFLLWVHYLDPHWPYTPDEEWVRRADPDWDGSFDLFERQARRELTKGQIIYGADELLDERGIEHARRRYAAEVAVTDEAIARLLDGLERQGLLDEAVVLFTVDHGESLGDHDYWFAHGEYLYDDTVVVPLAIRAPGRVPAGTRLEGLTRLEDAMPTLLGLIDIDPPAGMDGEDFSPQLRAGGEQRIGDRPVLLASDFRHIHPENPRRPVEGREGRWVGVRQGRHKLIRVPQADGSVVEELYDVIADPREAEDLRAARPDLAEQLGRELDRLLAEYPELGEADVDPVSEEEREVLRSLGYVG
jgi:arylsulfatase A-like enzyme